MGRRLIRDESGSVELPLRLLIALVVLGIVLPIVFGLFTGYSRLDTHRVIRESVNRIFIEARQVALGGNATMRTVQVTIPSGAFGAVQGVAIGDSLHGTRLTTARYSISGEPTATIVMGSPSVGMTNARNEPLLLSAGRHDLFVRHWITKDFSFVVVDREGAATDFGRFDVDYPQRQPDLAVSDLRLSPTNSVLVEYAVRNLGDADSPPFDVDVRVDGQVANQERLQLSAGEGRNLSTTIELEGEGLVEVVLDSGNEASERTGFNNAIRTRYEVTTPATPVDPAPGRSASCDAQSSNSPFELLFYHNIGWALVNLENDPIEQVPATDGTTVWGHAKELYGTVGTMTRAYEGSMPSHTDLPNTHESHDEIFHVYVDPEYLSLVGPYNEPGALEIEWESKYYPQWAWPSSGDRVWVLGQWIYDCGHPTPTSADPYYKTELHPAMAVATMREKADNFVDGQTYVPTTEVDVWINGDGGFAKAVLQCGTSRALNGECRGKTYSLQGFVAFTVPLPPRPAGNPELVHDVSGPPGASIEGATTVIPGTTEAFVFIEIGEDIPQGGTIKLAWQAIPSPPLRHFRLTVECILLKDDEDPLGDAEVEYAPADPRTHFWLNVNRATLGPGTGRWPEWTHIGEFAHEFYAGVDPQTCSGGTRNTGSDGSLLSDWASGRALRFEDAAQQPSAVFELHLPDQKDFTLIAGGWDSDGCDDAFGVHVPTLPVQCADDNDFLGYALVRFAAGNGYSCPRSLSVPPCTDREDSVWRGDGGNLDMSRSDFTIYYHLEEVP